METAAAIKGSRYDAFASQTLRALTSAVLLLGLIGDRRAR
jgi:hypothetical protein